MLRSAQSKFFVPIFRLPKRRREREVVAGNHRMRIQHETGRGTDLQSQRQGPDAVQLHHRDQVRLRSGQTLHSAETQQGKSLSIGRIHISMS